LADGGHLSAGARGETVLGRGDRGSGTAVPELTYVATMMLAVLAVLVGRAD
jgi:hypothetical protein